MDPNLQVAQNAQKRQTVDANVQPNAAIQQSYFAPSTSSAPVTTPSIQDPSVTQVSQIGNNEVMTTEQATDYLNNYQTEQLNSSTTSELVAAEPLPVEGGNVADMQIAQPTAQQAQANNVEQLRKIFGNSEIANQVLGLTSDLVAPVVPSLVNLYNTLRNNFGLENLEVAMTDLKSARRDAELRLRDRKGYQMNQRVGLGVISGRQTEIERQEMIELQFIDTQINTVNDQLSTAYGVIDKLTSLTQTDFQNASQMYTQKVNERFQMYNLIKTQEQQDKEWDFKINTQQTEWARANLQFYVDLIAKGSIDLATADSATKAVISKLEAQSGLGVGFTSKIIPPPSEELKSITQREGADGNLYADMIYIDKKSGAVRTDSKVLGSVYRAPVKATGGSGSSTKAPSKDEVLQAARGGMNEAIRSSGKRGKDGYLAPSTYKSFKAQWMSEGFSASQFDDQFYVYINPNHAQDYVSGGTLKKYFG